MIPLPYFLVLGAGIVWGGTFSLTIIATSGGTAPLVLAAYQSVLTTVMFAVICKLSAVPFFRLENLFCYCVLALIGICLPNVLYFSAAPYLSAGILSITVSTVPMLTYALMCMLRFEDLEGKRVLGIIFGMVAILLLVLPERGLESSDASFWTLVVLVCAACYAVENVYIDEGIDHSIDVRELLAGANFVASVILLSVVIIQGKNVPLSWFGTVSAWALAGIAVCSTTAYTLYFIAIKKAGAVFASQCAYIVTISGVLWGIAIFSESHTLWVWASVVVMVLGLFLVTPRERSDSKDSSVLQKISK